MKIKSKQHSIKSNKKLCEGGGIDLTFFIQLLCFGHIIYYLKKCLLTISYVLDAFLGPPVEKVKELDIYVIN